MEVEKLTSENFTTTYLQFQRRQAGVNLVYCPDEERYFYNAYCLEIDLLKELVSVEYEFLEDAINMINLDFATWELKAFETKKKECGSCSAK